MERLYDHPDARLIPLALEGRREAWDVLIARHQHRVLLALLARGVRIDHARDIVQETWSRLIAQQRAKKLDRLELPGLAIAQAMFLALDEGRRSRRTTPLADAQELASLPDTAPSIEERLTSRADLARAVAELEKCPPKAREVFALVYDDPGVPHAEAARRVGLSVQRVRQTLCEVRARLRAALEPSDDRSS